MASTKKQKQKQNVSTESNLVKPIPSSKSNVLNEHKYEFGGPVGATFIIFSLPLVIYALYFLCNEKACINISNMFSLKVWQEVYSQSFLPNSSISSLFSKDAWIIYIGWMFANVLLERILPGEVVNGTALPIEKSDKKQVLKYTMSGHLQFWVLILLMGHCIPIIIPRNSNSNVISLGGFAPLPLHLIYDNYIGLISASLVFCLILSIYLYVSSFFPSGKLLAKGGNSGIAVYDFFIGRELNPRIGSLDLKEFCELRPGLIGWFVINLGMATKQYLNRKAEYGVGSISLSMLLVTISQGYYVWDALYMEKAILTTMDITTDGFGYMLAFGDLSWVPFTYSLQARYLVNYDPSLELWELAIIMFIQGLGYYIFRSANSEKDAFRTDPEAEQVKHLKYLETKRGTKLLTSGWWGSARKINYTGDWLITLSWCLLCGFKSPVPYFQAVYFAILLIHRAGRDDEMCHEKYGDDWLEYKKRVPYLFIPYII
eukprot:gene6460-8888_t